MATSESDDFESADEEMNNDVSKRKFNHVPQWNSPTTIGSESDDDTEYVPHIPNTNTVYSSKTGRHSRVTDTAVIEKKLGKETSNQVDFTENDQPRINSDQISMKVDKDITSPNVSELETKTDIGPTHIKDQEINLTKNKVVVSVEKNVGTALCKSNEKSKDDKSKKFGAKKLGTKIALSNNVIDDTDNISMRITQQNILAMEESPSSKVSSIKEEITEAEMPEEMRSDKKFREVFKPQGWEELGNEIDLPEELTEETLHPIQKRVSSTGQEAESPSAGWGWTNWGVSSLINTASAGVSTLTSHVSHGLTLLEESMAISDEPKALTDKDLPNEDVQKDEIKEQQSAFGLGNLISGMSSITKLVESTGSKVMSGGLDTLEAIGKKTMEVLQDGDPGLKKKRAFFLNDSNKPNLSQTLREAKEKADSIEKTIEERQKMRKVHFESLFDDYQGLVHLEALEMLSKQSNIKIQQHLMSLDANELCSVQKMLEEVQELCELDEDDESEDDVMSETDLLSKLQEASTDLGINISFEKLHNACQESKTSTTVIDDEQEMFESAVSGLAQFTALSVERFHKTAELLLIKEHRSTVNEADSLVHLTNILCKQIGVLANAYTTSLNLSVETSEQPDIIKANITTIFMEASNASSYIQDAFKLLIPIVQVGAI